MKRIQDKSHQLGAFRVNSVTHVLIVDDIYLLLGIKL